MNLTSLEISKKLKETGVDLERKLITLETENDK